MPKITEVAPPGKKAEEWITSNKARFKKQYGDNWEPILYAKAWKMFGKKKTVTESELKDFKRKPVRGLYNFDHFEHPNGSFIQVSPHGHGVYRDESGEMHDFENMVQLKKILDKKKTVTEHKDPSEYVNKWKDVGFDVDVEELPSDGKKFTISNKGIETVISEPETGTYKTTDGKTFKTFDDAVDHLLKNTFSDINVTESTDYLKRMAGIPKTEKTNLTESFSPIADTIVFKQPNDLSIMAQKLNEIVNSDSKDDYINKYFIATNNGKHKFSAKQYDGHYEIYYDNTDELIHKGKGKVDRFNFTTIPEVVEFRKKVGSFTQLSGDDAMRYDPTSLKKVREDISFVSDEQAGISEEDDMTIRELKIACYTSGKILEMMMQGKAPERWNLSKITLAADYLTTVYTFMTSMDGNEPQYESLTESQLNEIFGRKISAEEEKIANDIYNMAKSTAKSRGDFSPVMNPDFLHYIKQLNDYSKYKETILKSWKKGLAAGRS
jgi:hypothetical protein